jgi:hypothetical protein
MDFIQPKLLIATLTLTLSEGEGANPWLSFSPERRG